MCQHFFSNAKEFHYISKELLSNFSENLKYVEKKEELYSIICHLDKRVLLAEVAPFVSIYCEIVFKAFSTQKEKTCEQLLNILGKCVLIKDIKHTNFDLSEDSYSKLKRFLSWLSFDLDTLATNFINFCVYKKAGTLAVLDLRAQGLTLEAIAMQKNLTRERIRQMESYAVRRCASEYNEYNIIQLVSGLRNGDQVITDNEFIETLNCTGSEILLYLLKNIKSNEFIYENDTKLFCLASNLMNKHIISAHLNQLPSYVFTENWISSLEQIAKDCNATFEYVEKIANLTYKNWGRYYSQAKLSLTAIYEYILLKFYPNGMKLYDKNETIRFRTLCYQTFGDIKLPTNNRAIDARLSEIGVLCQRGMYIHNSHIKIDIELINKIDTYIQDMPRTAITYAELYEIFQDELLIKTSVNNRFYMQGVLKYYLKDKYFTIKDLISKENAFTVDHELAIYIKENQIVTIRELLEKFKGLRESTLCQMLTRCPEVISIGNSQYIHSSSLKLENGDFSIKSIIEKNVQDAPFSSRVLLDILYATNINFLERNEITTHSKLFGIMSYMFLNEFSFSRPYFAKKGTKNITNTSVLLSLLNEHHIIEIDELMTICAENKILYTSINILISSITEEYLRINETELISCDDIDITEENLISIKEQYHSIYMVKGFFPLKAFNDFIFFPDLELEWTPFLLRSILQKYDDECIMVDIPTSDSYLMATIVINPDLKIDTYAELIKHLTKIENELSQFTTLKEL